VSQINLLETSWSAAVQSELLSCCSSSRWAHRVAAGWPYPSRAALVGAAETAFDWLDREDWLEAFAAHARIGEPREDDVRGSGEQAGIQTAGHTERRELAALTAEYERRFGHVFLICATGLSAGEMLASLRERIANSGDGEFAIATGEQRKITALRLPTVFTA
jgi:OHCU decarboxylase